MLASFLIIAISLVLFIYWFRYSCILLLRGRVGQAATVADNRFSFVNVQARLKTEHDLDPLLRALNRDYQVLTYLVQHAVGLELGSVEDRLLVLDYKVMQGWYRLTKTAAPIQARRALAEMASILGVLVGRMSEHVGVRTEA
ncbi:MAG: hypothetical protein LAP87_26585 [Acidobacteriia bacterium]|nr:hypothetical protein [Terriglobia bacterium]